MTQRVIKLKLPEIEKARAKPRTPQWKTNENNNPRQILIIIVTIDMITGIRVF